MSGSDVTFRPATQRDFLAFYGRESPWTLRGAVAEMNGEIVGFGGVYFDQDTAMAFSDMRDTMRRKRKDVVRAARHLMALIRSFGVPVFAYANPAEYTAPKLLARLGFEYIGSDRQGDLYRMDV